jgi:predicted methyltransferase
MLNNSGTTNNVRVFLFRGIATLSTVTVTAFYILGLALQFEDN